MVTNKQYVTGLFLAVLAVIGSISVVGLVKIGLTNLLLRFGIVSEAAQYGIIILSVIIIYTLVFGYGYKKAINKIFP